MKTIISSLLCFFLWGFSSFNLFALEQISRKPKKAVIIVGNSSIDWQKEGANKIKRKLQSNNVKIIKTFNVEGNPRFVISTLKKAVSLKPDVICIYQNSLIAAVLMKNVKKLNFLNIPVVMSNMFFQKKFHPMITGINFTSSVKPIFKLWKKILPNAKKVAILGSKNPFSMYLARQYKKYASQYNLNVIAEYYPEYGYQWKQAVQKINRTDADYLLIAFWVGLKMRSGKLLDNKEFYNLKYWTVRNMKKAYASFFNVVVMYGITLGICKDLIEEGTEIGNIALEVIKGRNITDIPIRESRFLYIALNLKHIKSLGLKIPFEILSNAKYIHKKYLGEYSDAYFDKFASGVRQYKKSKNWKWIPK